MMSVPSLHLYEVALLTAVVKLVCLLVAIAYFTLTERKIMAAVQRRHGPDVVGFWGLLQPLADGLKLFAKEMVVPTHANANLFVVAPMAVLALAFVSWSVVPFSVADRTEKQSVANQARALLDTVSATPSPKGKKPPVEEKTLLESATGVKPNSTDTKVILCGIAAFSAAVLYFLLFGGAPMPVSPPPSPTYQPVPFDMNKLIAAMQEEAVKEAAKAAGIAAAKAAAIGAAEAAKAAAAVASDGSSSSGS